MTARPSRRRITVVAASMAAASLVAVPAYARGGSGGGGGGTGGGGGGGTTTSVGAIQRASAAAVCDTATVMGVTVDKGFDKRVEMAVSYSGMASGKYKTVRLVNDATGLSINSYGSFPSSPSALVTNLGGTVPVGPVELSFTSQLHEGAFDGPVIETCTAHISTFAK